MPRNKELCPNCEHPLNPGKHLRQGQKITCAHCKTAFKVVDVDPLELEPIEVVKPSKANRKEVVPEVGCPECDHLITLKLPVHRGYRFRCPECQTELEIISTRPLEVDVAMPLNYTRFKF